VGIRLLVTSLLYALVAILILAIPAALLVLVRRIASRRVYWHVVAILVVLVAALVFVRVDPRDDAFAAAMGFTTVIIPVFVSAFVIDRLAAAGVSRMRQTFSSAAAAVLAGALPFGVVTIVSASLWERILAGFAIALLVYLLVRRRLTRSVALAVALLMLPAVGAAQSSRPVGSTVEVTIPSTTYIGGRHGWVYTPAGYPAWCGDGCNLIIAFDGAMYLGAMPLPEILDSLIAAKRTPPTVALLFDNGAPPGRIEDLANSERFAKFVATELLPWTRQQYRVTRAANRTILAGSSAGGLGAAYVALAYPELFGNVLSQSGAFWRGNEGSNSPPYEWLTEQYALAPKADIRFFLDVGSMETMGALGGSAPSLLDANDRFRSVLEKKGYTVQYFVVPNGTHSFDTWRRRLPVGIVALAPMP